MKYIPPLLIGLILTLSSVAQNKQIDSLKEILKQPEQDTIRVKALNSISILLASRKADYTNAAEFASEALILSNKLSYKRGIGASYYDLGYVDYFRGNYVEAMKNLLIGLDIQEKNFDKEGVANSYNLIGNIYATENNYNEAISYFSKSLAIRKEIGDKSGMSKSYNNLGYVNCKLGNYSEALKNHIISLGLRKQIGDKVGIANSYNNIGDIYASEKDYAQALSNYMNALQISEEMVNDYQMAFCCNSIGKIFISRKIPDSAKRYLERALFISTKIGSKEEIKESYANKSKFDSLAGNYKAAFEDYKQSIVYRDSLASEANTRKMVQEQMNYDFDKKQAVLKMEQDKKDEIQKLQDRKQKITTYFISGILILALGFVVFVYRSLRLSKRKNKIITLQKHLVEEKNKEILDSINYAKRLQDAILPPLAEIKKHLPESFVLYKPKDIVAGDFYWMQKLGDDIFLAAADCTGHGVPGAMVSVVCSNALNRAVKEFGIKETGKILDKVRDLVLETFEKSESDVKDGMDISLCSINIKNRQIQWSGANNPLWYIQEKELKIIVGDKQPVGKQDGQKPFSSHNISLQPGDVIYLFTDGYADQFGGEKGKKFKYKPFQEKLLAMFALHIQQQGTELLNTFDAWKGLLEQVDDVLVIGVKV